MNESDAERIGRLSAQLAQLLGQWQVSEQPLTLAASTGTQALPADPLRLAVAILPAAGVVANANGVYISTLGVPVPTGNYVQHGSHPVLGGLVFPLWGALVQSAWFVYNSNSQSETLVLLTVRAQQ